MYNQHKRNLLVVQKHLHSPSETTKSNGYRKSSFQLHQCDQSTVGHTLHSGLGHHLQPVQVGPVGRAVGLNEPHLALQVLSARPFQWSTSGYSVRYVLLAWLQLHV